MKQLDSTDIIVSPKKKMESYMSVYAASGCKSGLAQERFKMFN